MHIVILDYGTLKTGNIEPLKGIAKRLDTYENTSESELVERICACDVIISNKVQLHAEALKQTRAQLICVAATGFNNVDIEAATKLNISVTNVAGYSTMSVVQHTFALMFNLLGNTHRYSSDKELELWKKSEHFCLINFPIQEVSNKTLVIIGVGDIGLAVKKTAESFGMKVILAERKGYPARGGREVFEKAITKADIIAIHCPLTPETHHLFSNTEFNQLKKSAVILNLARGPVVDESALFDALSLGKISGAATDVLSQEPPNERNPLLTYKGKNLLITPHIGWASQESVSRLIVEIKENILAFNAGQERNRVC